jgi:hypothetical protein
MIRESTGMAWTETQSASFSVRHESADADAAMETLDRLEEFRAELGELFETTPGDVSVIVHPRPWALALAHPYLPLARLAVAPASRRYMTGWFSKREVHVLAPAALEERASAVAGSRDALLRSPLHEYAHLVIGANNPALPPPFTPASFARYLRWAWLCEGAATWLAGQTPHLRPAIARRLHEGPPPAFPPAGRDAPLLGGTVFALLDQAAGPEACVAMASRLESGGSAAAIERAFARPCPEVERDWREHVAAATAA